jgi:hypothetical protein
MAVIVTNKKGGKVVVRGTANTTLTLDDLKKDVSETVNTATLTQIWVSSEYNRRKQSDLQSCFRRQFIY